MNLSVLVGCLNNLDYTQHFYKTFRDVYPTIELVFVSYGSDDWTNMWLDELDDPNTITYWEEDRKTFSDTYNKAIELATKDYVVFLHNDIVVAPGFLENIEKYLNPKNVVSYTTIEPPIFAGHERPGKIIQDFGTELGNFNTEKNFHEFVSYEQQNQENKTEPGITFFMALSRKVLLDMGGFDNIFNPYFSEDDDLIKRLKLQNLNCFTSLDAICYHFVSKTSRFTEEAKLNTQRIERNSNRNFLRKWGSMNSNNKFNVGFIVKNCTEQLIEILEPWCDCLYYGGDPMGYWAKTYMDKEQSNTTFDLSDRIKYYDNEKNNDILVSFDGSKLDNNNFEIIKNLQNILANTSPGETYEIDIFNIYVHSPINYIKDLIFIQK